MIPESRETRTPHPQQSKMVNFSVKAGYGDRNRAIKGMEALHYTVKTFDTSQTWEEAFLSGYGIKLDCQRFSIRRSRGPKDTVPCHSLQTKIREILGEYHKSQQSLYGVTIVVNSAFAETSSPIKQTSRSDTLANECEMPQEITSVVNGTRNNRASTSAAAAANNGHNTESLVRDFLLRVGREDDREVSPPPPKLTKMTNYDEESDDDSEYDASNNRLRMRTPKIVNVVSQYKNTSGGNRQVQFEEASFNIPGQNNGQHNFDCASVFSQESQYSQYECLAEGIEYDNTFKDKIGLRLRKKFTAGQFVRFKDALKELKEDKTGKLMRFAEKQPLLVSFLRELFEI